MKILSTLWERAFILLLWVLPAAAINAQSTSFELSIRNLTQTASNKLEFDIYLLNTDVVQNFYLSTIQFGILFNSGIYTGGSMSLEIDNTYSGLGPFQYLYKIGRAHV